MKNITIPEFKLADFLGTDEPYSFIYNIEDTFAKAQAMLFVAKQADNLGVGEEFNVLMKEYTKKMCLAEEEAEERKNHLETEEYLIQLRKKEAEEACESAWKFRREADEALDKAKKNLKVTRIAFGVGFVCAVINFIGLFV